jgi:hypothetical protein
MASSQERAVRTAESKERSRRGGGRGADADWHVLSEGSAKRQEAGQRSGAATPPPPHTHTLAAHLALARDTLASQELGLRVRLGRLDDAHLRARGNRGRVG